MAEEIIESEAPIELPSMYFNGFQVGLTNGDVSAITLLNGQPQFVLNMSYTTAKTLAVALTGLIDQLETVTGRPIMTTKEIDAGMRTVAKKETKQ